MTLNINSDLVRDKDGRIRYRYLHQGGREHYNLRVWLEADRKQLDDIDRVEYTLHRSFKDPIRISNNRGDNFSIFIWSYGMFAISAKLYYLDGMTSNIRYFMTFDLPEDDGTNYTLASPS